MALTTQERLDIINAVLSGIRTNSRSIEQLTEEKNPSDSDLVEISNGRHVTFGTLREKIIERINQDLDDLLPTEEQKADGHTYAYRYGHLTDIDPIKFDVRLSVKDDNGLTGAVSFGSNPLSPTERRRFINFFQAYDARGGQDGGRLVLSVSFDGHVYDIRPFCISSTSDTESTVTFLLPADPQYAEGKGNLYVVQLRANIATEAVSVEWVRLLPLAAIETVFGTWGDDPYAQPEDIQDVWRNS